MAFPNDTCCWLNATKDDGDWAVRNLKLKENQTMDMCLEGIATFAQKAQPFKAKSVDLHLLKTP
jgi:hypothetical protein